MVKLEEAVELFTIAPGHQRLLADYNSDALSTVLLPSVRYELKGVRL